MICDDYAKIDNSDGALMPVSIERIFENERYKQISLAHYYELNGDLMTDPEMIFTQIKSCRIFIPSYFKQDNLGIEQESIVMENGEIKGYKAKMQADQTLFANMWLRNIKEQQNL